MRSLQNQSDALTPARGRLLLAHALLTLTPRRSSLSTASIAFGTTPFKQLQSPAASTVASQGPGPSSVSAAATAATSGLRLQARALRLRPGVSCAAIGVGTPMDPYHDQLADATLFDASPLPPTSGQPAKLRNPRTARILDSDDSDEDIRQHPSSMQQHPTASTHAASQGKVISPCTTASSGGNGCDARGLPDQHQPPHLASLSAPWPSQPVSHGLLIGSDESALVSGLQGLGLASPGVPLPSRGSGFCDLAFPGHPQPLAPGTLGLASPSGPQPLAPGPRGLAPLETTQQTASAHSNLASHGIPEPLVSELLGLASPVNTHALAPGRCDLASPGSFQGPSSSSTSLTGSPPPGPGLWHIPGVPAPPPFTPCFPVRARGWGAAAGGTQAGASGWEGDDSEDLDAPLTICRTVVRSGGGAGGRRGRPSRRQPFLDSDDSGPSGSGRSLSPAVSGLGFGAPGPSDSGMDVFYTPQGSPSDTGAGGASGERMAQPPLFEGPLGGTLGVRSCSGGSRGGGGGGDASIGSGGGSVGGPLTFTRTVRRARRARIVEDEEEQGGWGCGAQTQGDGFSPDEGGHEASTRGLGGAAGSGALGVDGVGRGMGSRHRVGSGGVLVVAPPRPCTSDGHEVMVISSDEDMSDVATDMEADTAADAEADVATGIEAGMADSEREGEGRGGAGDEREGIKGGLQGAGPSGGRTPGGALLPWHLPATGQQQEGGVQPVRGALELAALLNRQCSLSTGPPQATAVGAGSFGAAPGPAAVGGHGWGALEGRRLVLSPPGALTKPRPQRPRTPRAPAPPFEEPPTQAPAPGAEDVIDLVSSSDGEGRGEGVGGQVQEADGKVQGAMPRRGRGRPRRATPPPAGGVDEEGEGEEGHHPGAGAGRAAGGVPAVAGGTLTLPTQSPHHQLQLVPPRKRRGRPAGAGTGTGATPANPHLAFARKRAELARSLYQEWNQQVFRGGLPGDLPVVWNPRLLTTAGQVLDDGSRNRDKSDPSERIPTALELSTKVVDSLERLRTTLAHEMCHVAAWTLDREFHPHHGPSFWRWAGVISKAVPGITVTRLHTYATFAPHRWRCQNASCGKTYSRHRETIDPQRHMCGVCHGRLVYLGKFDRRGVKVAGPGMGGDSTPGAGAGAGAVARGAGAEGSSAAGAGGAAAGGGGAHAYRQFVKQNFAQVKSSQPPGTPHGTIMKVLSSKWSTVKTISKQQKKPQQEQEGQQQGLEGGAAGGLAGVAGQGRAWGAGQSPRGGEPMVGGPRRLDLGEVGEEGRLDLGEGGEEGRLDLGEGGEEGSGVEASDGGASVPGAGSPRRGRRRSGAGGGKGRAGMFSASPDRLVMAMGGLGLGDSGEGVEEADGDVWAL